MNPSTLSLPLSLPLPCGHLVFGKEKLENTGDIKVAIEERKDLTVDVEVGDKTYTVCCKCRMSCIDQKMRTILSGKKKYHTQN